ncbi:MAG: hypothetical protein ACYCO4_06970 [Sulfobacillus sp.]
MPTDLTGFDLDASVSVSDLRAEASWQRLLIRYGKLRVERRGRGSSAVVGVLLAPPVWREVCRLIAAQEAAEERAVEQIIDSRAGGELLQGQELTEGMAARLRAQLEKVRPER